MIGQAPRPGSSTLLLRQDHVYQARWLAPVPCAVLGSAPTVSSLLSAMLQQFGSQFGRSQAWSTVRADTSPLPGWNPPAGHTNGMGPSSFNACVVYTEATWSAPDTAVDPSLAKLPGVGLVPLVDMWDASSGELLYDRNAIAQPSAPAPGPAPAPPTSTSPPVATTRAPSAAKASAGVSGAVVFAGLLILGLGIAAIVSR